MDKEPNERLKKMMRAMNPDKDKIGFGNTY